jgi:hypothetical protein
LVIATAVLAVAGGAAHQVLRFAVASSSEHVLPFSQPPAPIREIGPGSLDAPLYPQGMPFISRRFAVPARGFEYGRLAAGLEYTT